MIRSWTQPVESLCAEALRWAYWTVSDTAEHVEFLFSFSFFGGREGAFFFSFYFILIFNPSVLLDTFRAKLRIDSSSMLLYVHRDRTDYHNY